MQGTRPLTSWPKAVALKNVRLATARGSVTIGTRVFSWGTAAAGLSWCGICRRHAAVTGATLAPFTDGTQEDARGATSTGLYPDSIYRTVNGAGATLNTGVLVGNECFAVLYIEYFMGTDDGAHAAAVAGLDIELQGYNIFQVSEHFHSS